MRERVSERESLRERGLEGDRHGLERKSGREYKVRVMERRKLNKKEVLK